MQATLKLIGPGGAPIDLHLSPEDKGEDIKILLERVGTLTTWMQGNGWAFADAHPTGPSVKELTAGPTFAGYPCSPTVNEAGLPTWVISGGQQAHRREKQGDVWYSTKQPDGTYEQVIRIPKGEQAPAVLGLGG